MSKSAEPSNAESEPIEPSKRSRRLSVKRERLRDDLWPNASHVAWSRHNARGFTTVPRIVPLVLRLISHLTEKGDASRVYLDLICRAFDEQMVIVRDEEEMAYTAGYDGPRAVRTWREHIETLRKWGFVLTKELGNRDVGHILLIDPNLTIFCLKAVGLIDQKWWNMYVMRMSDIGASLPDPSSEVIDFVISQLPPVTTKKRSVPKKKVLKPKRRLATQTTRLLEYK